MSPRSSALFRVLLSALFALVVLALAPNSAFAQFSGDTNTQDFAGNVGIGVTYPTLPTGKLEIVNPTGTGGTGSFLQITGSADNSHYPDIVLKGGNGVGYTIQGYPSVRTSNAGYALTLWGGYASVIPPIAAVVDSGSGSFYVASGLTGANVPFRVWSAGSVGVGTAAYPSATVDVRGTSQASGSARRNVMAVDTTAWAQGVGGGISFGGNVATDGSGNPVPTLDLANIWGVKENATANDTAGALLFATHATGATPAERMRITSGGSVGIGTTPAAGNLLDVAGNIHASGSITGGSVIGATIRTLPNGFRRANRWSPERWSCSITRRSMKSSARRTPTTRPSPASYRRTRA